VVGVDFFAYAIQRGYEIKAQKGSRLPLIRGKKPALTWQAEGSLHYSLSFTVKKLLFCVLAEKQLCFV